jgi:copper oxidase (laccase) domain-containing protein
MMPNQLIQPTAILEPFGPKVAICLFGRPENWSFEVEPQAPKRISSYCFDLGVKTIVAPIADFSAVVRSRSELSETNLLDADFSKKVSILRNFGDGAEAYPGEAFYVRSGDCPTLVIYDPESGRLVCAHAGRDCLFDRGRFRNCPAREHESVVGAVLNCFEQTENLRAFITCGISGRNFKHEMILNGELRSPETELMLEFFKKIEPKSVDLMTGSISLKGIITAQLVFGGVNPQNIGYDLIDTFGDKSNDQYTWWSHRRGNKDERNGVLVLNRSL